MKTIKRATSMLLILAIMLQIIPISVFGWEFEEDYADGSIELTNEEVQVDEEDLFAKPAVVLFEDTTLRQEDVKHFRMSDGSYVAVNYGTPVHYLADDSASWEDIDNTLVCSADVEMHSTAKTQEVASDQVYSAKNGSNESDFAIDLSTGFLFSAQNDNYKIAMYLSDTSSEPKMVTQNTSLLPDQGRVTETEQTESYNTHAEALISYPDERTNITKDNTIYEEDRAETEVGAISNIDALNGPEAIRKR